MSLRKSSASDFIALFVAGQFAEQVGPDKDKVPAAVIGGQKLRGLVQLVLGEVLGGPDDLVEDQVEGGQEDDHHLVLSDLDEAKVVDGDLGDTGGDNKTQVVGLLGQEERHPVQQRVEVPPALGKVPGVVPDLARGADAVQEAVDIETQPFVRGDPPGRGVGFEKIAHLLQLDHDVADGGRGIAEESGLGDEVRADRLALAEIAFHHLSQDLLVFFA